MFLNIKKKYRFTICDVLQEAIMRILVIFMRFLEVEFISKSAKLLMLPLNRMSTS